MLDAVNPLASINNFVVVPLSLPVATLLEMKVLMPRF